MCVLCNCVAASQQAPRPQKTLSAVFARAAIYSSSAIVHACLFALASFPLVTARAYPLAILLFPYFLRLAYYCRCKIQLDSGRRRRAPAHVHRPPAPQIYASLTALFSAALSTPYMPPSPKLLLMKMWKMSWIKSESQSPIQQPTISQPVNGDAGNARTQRVASSHVNSRPNAEPMLIPDSAIERSHTWSGAASSATAYTPTSPLAVAMQPASGSNTPRSFIATSTGSGFLLPPTAAAMPVGISPPVSPGSRPGAMKRKDSFVSANGRAGGSSSAATASPIFADGRLDFLTYLPYEIAMVIVIYADFPAITTIAQVSRSWNRFARDNAVWRRLFLQQSEWRTPKALVAAGRTAGGRRRRFCQGAPGDATSTNNSNSSNNNNTLGVATPSSSVCTSGANTPRIGDDFGNYRVASDSVANGARQLLSSYSGSSLRPAIALQHMVAPSPNLAAINCVSDEPGYIKPVAVDLSGRLVGANWNYLFQQRLELDRRWAKGISRVHTITGHADSVYCVQYDSDKIVTGSRDRTIKIWDSRTLRCMRTLTGHEASVLCLKYDSTTMVTGSSDSSVIVWDLASGRSLQKLVSHTAGVLDVAFSDNYIVSCSKDCTIKVWDRATGKLLRTMVGHRGPVNAVQLHGGRIVSASGDSLIKMWDVKTGSLIRTFAGHTRGLACVQFDGKTIVSGSSDQLIKVWNSESGQCIQTLKGHKDLVRTLHFTGGRRAVSGSYDQTVKVWDIVTGECTLDLKDVHTSWVFDVQFSTSRIVSTSQDQKIVVWDFGQGLDLTNID
ncbi:hypothetical protein H4R99_006656 [Coemansia sp. RSA 1722]|nr:hypothetical protein LPJ57_001916 [Coemansia sp. RSA 486]KAJ2236289.1 hypothetical protein IWW45_001911 [Coemansia sp. RSA 485]KAJ2591715.1 hypothetical protein H4R99_006656 [Coemansia sp. RSA 1722]